MAAQETARVYVNFSRYIGTIPTQHILLYRTAKHDCTERACVSILPGERNISVNLIFLSEKSNLDGINDANLLLVCVALILNLFLLPISRKSILKMEKYRLNIMLASPLSKNTANRKQKANLTELIADLLLSLSLNYTANRF